MIRLQSIKTKKSAATELYTCNIVIAPKSKQKYQEKYRLIVQLGVMAAASSKTEMTPCGHVFPDRGSSSFLQVTRTIINSRHSSNFGQIRQPTVGLAALERLKIDISCGHSSAFIFDWIFFIFAGKEKNHKISDEFEFRTDLISACGVSCYIHG